MRIAAAALFLLAACAPRQDVRQVVAQCRLDADRVYAGLSDHRAEMVEDYTDTCMTARGYAFRANDPGCPITYAAEADPVRCYAPLSQQPASAGAR
jgi:hypothetical protein